LNWPAFIPAIKEAFGYADTSPDVGATMGSYRDNIYMITCPARSGSTMLVHLLRSHPDIISHDEVFSAPGTLGGMAGTYLIKRRGNQAFSDRMAADKDRDPIKFLYKIVLDLQGKRAVCFKLKHDELIRPDYKTLRDEIVNDRDFRIIHLRRENLLRRYLSHYIANHVTRVTWAIHGQTVPEIQPVVLDPRQCQTDFETVLGREKEFAELFGQHPGFHITYEDMITPGSEKLQCLLDFMGVPRRELTTTTQKLGCDDLRKVVANFDELRSHFAGSPYSKFFEDA
jgi:LPS sulfotransferase NodH